MQGNWKMYDSELKDHHLEYEQMLTILLFLRFVIKSFNIDTSWWGSDIGQLFTVYVS